MLAKAMPSPRRLSGARFATARNPAMMASAIAAPLSICTGISSQMLAMGHVQQNGGGKQEPRDHAGLSGTDGRRPSTHKRPEEERENSKRADYDAKLPLLTAKVHNVFWHYYVLRRKRSVEEVQEPDRHHKVQRPQTIFQEFTLSCFLLLERAKMGEWGLDFELYDQVRSTVFAPGQGRLLLDHAPKARASFVLSRRTVRARLGSSRYSRFHRPEDLPVDQRGQGDADGHNEERGCVIARVHQP